MRVLLYLPVPRHTLNLSERGHAGLDVPSTVLYRIAGSLMTIVNLCCKHRAHIGDDVMVTEEGGLPRLKVPVFSRTVRFGSPSDGATRGGQSGAPGISCIKAPR